MKHAFLIVLALISLALIGGVANAQVITPGPTITPTSPYAVNPEGFVSDFYDFGIAAGILLAFGAIVYGGVKYIVAGGNPGGQSDARDQVTQALVGLLLLLGAVLVLRTINPAFNSLKLPAVPVLLDVAQDINTCPDACPQGTNCVQGKCETCSAACLQGERCVATKNGNWACVKEATSDKCSPISGNTLYLCGPTRQVCQTPCTGGICERVRVSSAERYYCSINGVIQ